MSRKFAFVALCLCISATITGCGTKTDTKSAGEAKTQTKGIPGITERNYPGMNGSTSTIPLSDLILSRALGLQGELRRQPLGYGGIAVTITFPISTSSDKCESYNSFRRGNYHEGTHQAYERLATPEKPPRNPMTTPSTVPSRRPTELILVAREPSEDELKLAKRNGVEFDIRPVAIDAFVFIVNSQNPVKSLTLDNIRSIYTGKATNWSKFGGRDEKIRAFGRERNSGSQELMDKLVMKYQKTIQVHESVLYGMSRPIERVSTTPNAIAYSVYYYEHIMSPNTDNRLLGVNGVVPTTESIADRKYPLTADVYVVTRKGLDPKSPAAVLRDWLLSDEGHRLVVESGYVPIRKPR